jgi:drug/metabolite transporter (DMT)-like permease
MITRKAPEGREVFSAGLVVTGAVLAMDVTGFAKAENLRGAPSAVAAAFCFAAFFVTTSRLGYSGTPALRSFICCLISGVLLLGLAGVGQWELIPRQPAPGVAALWLISLGLFGQVVPIFLMVHFGPRTGSGLGSILTATELPVAVAVSVALLGDPLGKAQIAGVLLVLVGILWPHLPRLAAQWRSLPPAA